MPIGCHELKEGQILACKDCGLELKVVKGCKDCSDESKTCDCSEPCTFSCCGGELELK